MELNANSKVTVDPAVKVDRLYKSFGDLKVLKGISTEIQKGQVVSIIGLQDVENPHFYAVLIFWKSRHLGIFLLMGWKLLTRKPKFIKFVSP